MEQLLGNTNDTMKSESVYTKQQRIADLGRMHPEVSFSSLSYHIDIEWLRASYQATRKDGACGIDGVTAQEYEENLDWNLQDLLNRFKTGRYYAPAVRRIYIAKDGKGKEVRPIGIPTFEDKILQRAVSMILEPLYEMDFSDSSYGYRPGRSAHQALERLWKESMKQRGCWVLALDIEKFFDTMSHSHLMAIVRKRVCDGVIIRTIGKWLHAGVLENGYVAYKDTGSPQGGVISPILSNIYLHEVLDVWFEKEIMSRLKTSAKLIRFADDIRILFKDKHDAERVMHVIGKRFARFSLKLHPGKTRLINFTQPNGANMKSESFDFLGFTHYWGTSGRGKPVVKRKTSKEKLTKAIGVMYRWCQKNRHKTVKKQWEDLTRKVKGHYGYYGITFNSESLGKFQRQVVRSWQKWLNRRAREKVMPWDKFNKLLQKYPIPNPRIVHKFT